jgi:hypothetical protein
MSTGRVDRRCHSVSARRSAAEGMHQSLWPIPANTRGFQVSRRPAPCDSEAMLHGNTARLAGAERELAAAGWRAG